MNSPPSTLSKSRLLAWRQCPKRLWLETYRRDLLEISPGSQRRIAQGHRVGEVARSLVPDGVLVETDGDLERALRKTGQLLVEGRPLFEATFEHDGVLVRSDLLIPSDSGYRLVEVKSASSLKDYYRDDCAVQTWVLHGAGVRVSRVELAHIDSLFVYQTLADYRGLFRHADLTEPIRPLLEQVAGWVAEAQKVLANDVPDIEIGDHCKKPYSCQFLTYCQPTGPDYPVSLLPRGRKVAATLQAEGYVDLREVPEGRLTNPLHERIRRITSSGIPERNPAARDFLQSLSYPRYYLDFETINFAVPIWLGTSPGQHHPFQWSCHIENHRRQLHHQQFLDTTGDDPQRAFAESLLAALGTTGPVFVYSNFERTRLNELAQHFPDLSHNIDALVDRLVDLYPITRRYYYHPEQRGSWSLKSVLPTIAPDLDYASIGEVHDGDAAQDAYLEAIDVGTLEHRGSELRTALLNYCELDTLALVRLAWFLQDGQS